jgi:hypothetical protein
MVIFFKSKDLMVKVVISYIAIIRKTISENFYKNSSVIKSYSSFKLSL